jgi:hypothetical protein
MSQSHARTNLIRSIPERNEHKRRGKEEVKRRGKRVKNRRSILAAIARDLCLNRPALHLPLERETPRKKERDASNSRGPALRINSHPSPRHLPRRYVLRAWRFSMRVPVLVLELRR